MAGDSVRWAGGVVYLRVVYRREDHVWHALGMVLAARPPTMQVFR